MKRYLFILLLAVPLLLSCTQANEPIDVAESFWYAVQKGDIKKLKRTLTKESLQREELMKNLLPIGKVELSRTVIEGENAWVTTSIEVTADRTFVLPARTVLIKEGRNWKVDYDATMTNLSMGSSVARIMSSVQDIGKSIERQIGQVLGDLEREMPEIEHEIDKQSEKIEQEMESQLSGFREWLRNLSEQISEAFKDPAPQEESRTIEI